MEHFWDIVETIPEGLGFTHFQGEHLIWLAVFVIFAALSCIVYRKAFPDKRRSMRRIFALLLLADELYKMVCLTIGGNYIAEYLPLHLCSINIFLIAFHVWKPSRTLDNFLYIACLPGALAALLFPSWTSLPTANFMYWHSFTVHILLATYPLMTVIGGDLKPSIRALPGSLLFMVGLAIPVYGVNLLLDTNFMFLMYAEPGNPLLLFQELWGCHLLGFPVIIAGVIVVMYAPLLLANARQKRVVKA